MPSHGFSTASTSIGCRDNRGARAGRDGPGNPVQLERQRGHPRSQLTAGHRLFRRAPWAYTGKNMPGTPVRILLARHGETEFNVAGRWQGQGNSLLTERGLAQARELGRALAQDRIAAVYSSDLGRAVHTADEVALPPGLEVHHEPRLRELHVGGWTGKNGV